jgi:hypothetical protein
MMHTMVMRSKYIMLLLKRLQLAQVLIRIA